MLLAGSRNDVTAPEGQVAVPDTHVARLQAVENGLRVGVEDIDPAAQLRLLHKIGLERQPFGARGRLIRKRLMRRLALLGRRGGQRQYHSHPERKLP